MANEVQVACPQGMKIAGYDVYGIKTKGHPDYYNHDEWPKNWVYMSRHFNETQAEEWVKKHQMLNPHVKFRINPLFS